MAELINSKYKQEYEKRATDIHNVITHAYSDYYNLIYLTPYLEEYKSCDKEECQLMLPTKYLLNSIVRAFQEELILIVCSLDNKNKDSNSIIQLKAHLYKYILNFNLYSKSILKIPENTITNIETARNKAIAHIDFYNESDKVSIKDVKDRLDTLTKCFNSFLFGETVKYKIDDNLIDKIVKQSEIGVQQLFSGFVSYICNRNKS